ncbi:hypothetical protein ACP4OV_006081 [Aristida adscensionis]
MPPTRLSIDRFNNAVEYMINMGAQKETAVKVLKRLLPLYDGNWDYIEADNYSVLADGVFDDPDSKDGPKRQGEKKNPDQCSKKHKTKEHGQKPKPYICGNGNEESVEVPHQQEANKALERKAIAAKLQKPSSQISIEEPKIETSHTEAAINDHNSSPLLLEGYGNHSFVTPLALVCPQAPEPSPRKGLLVAREEHMADACSSQAIVSSKDFPTNFEVVLSNSGYGKLSFSFNSSLENSSGFRMPGTESICKAMEARCIRTYKILEPNFSFMKLLEDTCQCILALGSRSGDPRDRSIQQILGRNAVGGVGQIDSRSMQIIQHQVPSSVKRQFHDVNDITKGEERVNIPIVCGVEGSLPPPFTYIPQNITFQDAYISLSLARIGDENYCSDCFGDCLAEPLPCACATETGGEFAYTRDGLLKEGFLDACLLMIQEPLKQPHFYCKICPLEKFKNEVNPDPCKGHPIRKFIKECWRKCSCSRYCGNRVVQRGITRNLQVFLTPGKKGWGLRAAEKLPRGAFVCEYVGEILTNTELYHRTMNLTGNAKHTYPVVLDADWGSENILKDEEALCLDATFYGNVARFINHRCFDANIIDIPVEIETPDHHYFHMAFFTKREIEPFEELTWTFWTTELILMMSTILSRLSNVIVEASFVGTKGAQDLRLGPWCYEYKDLRN